jgi:hypothetical protein
MISAWCSNLTGLFLESSRYGAELQKDFFERVFSLFSASCWNLTGLFSNSSNHPVIDAALQKTFPRKVLSQSLSGAEI